MNYQNIQLHLPENIEAHWLGLINTSVNMKMFVDVAQIYFHRDAVDFRKSINGLQLVVEEQMSLSPFDEAIFVFCNKGRDKLKVLYWDQTGRLLMV